MRVVFLGNHTVGVKALEAIDQSDEITGVVAHPPDPEDGVRYLSVHDFAKARAWPVVRGKGSGAEVDAFVRAAAPDLIWVTDYRYLLPPSLLSTAPLGAVNLHPSLLPRYRGRAPINWAILNGETTLGLTAHLIDEGVDTGDIITQARYDLDQGEDVGDALRKLYPLYAEVTRHVLACFRAGSVPRLKQDDSQATVFLRRKPEDGRIDWARPASAVVNLVRATAAPYPGAFTTLAGCKLIVWRAQLEAGSSARGAPPGAVLSVSDGRVVVSCGEGAAALLKTELEPAQRELRLAVGSVLGR